MGDATTDLDSELDAPVAKCASRPRTGSRRRMSVLTLMKLVVVFACAFGLIAALARSVGAAREAARRSQCSCNYCQILLAFHNYHSQYLKAILTIAGGEGNAIDHALGDK